MRYVASYVLFFAVIIFAACSSGGNDPVRHSPAVGDSLKTAGITFRQTAHDFGTIQQGAQVIAWFDYVNTGDGMLVIDQIKTGCGCTVPGWKKDPLAPGDSASVKVIFDSSGKTGYQNINITVHSNAENSRKELILKAIVEK